MNFRQIKAIEKANKEKWVKHFGKIPDVSGVYILTRRENGFKYAYVGQAKRILTRLAEHLSGYQHIDLSLKKHGLYSEENPTGWEANFIRCELERLDDTEQYLIKQYANAGWQMRNKTAGGQGDGHVVIGETREPKGYRDGLKQGYKNAKRDVAKWFDKNLTAVINGKPNKNKEKALSKFQEFLKID